MFCGMIILKVSISRFYIMGGFLAASGSLSNQKSGYPGFRRKAPPFLRGPKQSFPPLRNRLRPPFLSLPRRGRDVRRVWVLCTQTRSGWAFTPIPGAHVNKRVLLRSNETRRGGVTPSPNPCHEGAGTCASPWRT